MKLDCQRPTKLLHRVREAKFPVIVVRSQP
jgi:hypothetical protein